jgi:DNA-directed RNA polymerase specialized sigma24 family protein
VEKIADKNFSELLKAGDKAAFEIIFDRYAPAVLGFISRRIADKELSELILTKTFLSAWEKRETIAQEEKRIFVRLISIARDLSLNHLGGAVNNVKTEIRANDSFVHIVKGQKIASVLYLVYYKGLTLAEAANELGVTINTLKTRLRTELKQLRGVTSE